MLLSRLSKAVGLFVLAFGMVVISGSDDAGAATKAEDAKKFTQDLKKAKDVKTKVTALDELGRLGQIQYKYAEEAIPDMFVMLKDKDAGLRAAAARAIGLVGPDDEKTVGEMVDALKAEKDEPVKLAIVTSLGQLGGRAKDAIPELRNQLKGADAKSKFAKTVNASIKNINGTTKKK